jgi:spore coat protein H
MSHKSIIVIFLVIILVLSAFIICTGSGQNNLNSGLESTSHAPDTTPDYEMVFPDDKIQDIYINISSKSWDEMQEDMEKHYGEPGNRNMTGVGEKMPGERMDSQGGGDPGKMTEEDPIYVPANISFNRENWDHVGLRYKGFNSLMTAWQSGIGKISLKIDMDHYDDEYPDTKNQKLYGFKELNLQSGGSDKSGIREKIVPEIFRDAGVPAPETAFYRVYLDHGNGSEYFGLYTLAEAVDDTVIETQFSNSSGNLYKPEGEGATFAKGNLNLSDFEKKTNEKKDDYSDITTLYNILHSETRNTSPEKWRSDLESVFNVSEFLTWLATNTLISNWDTYGGNSRNYYLYNDPDTGAFNWIPWDNNNALMSGMGGDPGMGAGGNGNQSFGPGMPPGGMNMTPPGMMGNPGMGVGGNGSQSFGLGLPPGGMNMTPPGMMVNPDMGAGGSGNQSFGPGMPPSGMNMSPPGGPGMGAGGMGGSVSFSMENVTDRWPLIRYLMDDPVYHEMYKESLKKVVETSFNTTKLETKFDKYHDLIESSVIGPEGERKGYTYLNKDSDFDNAYEELKKHIRSQYQKATDYLSSEN